MNTYIASGLTALARNAELKESRWFLGHIGAAVMAGGFLLEHDRLSEEAGAGLKTQLNNIMEKNPEFFVPFAAAEAIPLTGLLDALERNCLALSCSGHGVIYGTLALRALQAFPDMATAALLEGIIKTLEFTLNDNPARYFGVDDFREYGVDTVNSNLEALVQRAYRVSCGGLAASQSINGQYYFFAGEKLHGITHAQALLNLASLGYRELANKGMASLNKQLELNEKRPDGLAGAEPRPLNIFDKSFWNQGFDDVHSIKLAYSAAELNRVFGDEAIPLAELAGHFGLLK